MDSREEGKGRWTNTSNLSTKKYVKRIHTQKELLPYDDAKGATDNSIHFYTRK